MPTKQQLVFLLALVAIFGLPLFLPLPALADGQGKAELVEGFYDIEEDADTAWMVVMAEPSKNILQFVANPCVFEVLLQEKDGYWEGLFDKSEGLACHSLEKAFRQGQVVMHIVAVPEKRDAQGRIAAFDVQIPLSVRDYVNGLKSSAALEDFFGSAGFRYTLRQ